MKKLILATAFTTIALSLNVTAAEKSAPADGNVQEVMKKYEAAATPGESHKRLADLEGKWKTSSQMWHTADGKPMTSDGTSKFKMILGGRWLQQDFKGKAMGKPFDGMGLLGYDNIKGKYESHWFDSMSTGAMVAQGDYDSASKTIKDKGSMSCPLSEGKVQDFRSEWQMVSKNKMIFSMFGKGPQGGNEFKMMEITYTR